MQGSSTQLTTQSTNSASTEPSLWKRRANKTVDTAIDWAETLTPLVKEVAAVFKDAPLVGPIAGVIVQIIEIRKEIKQDKKRCFEIIDRVLDLSEWIYKALREIGKYGERVQDALAKIQTSLKYCETALTKTLQALEERKNRGLWKRAIQRGPEDLDQIDRSVEDLNHAMTRDMIFSIALQQAIHNSNESTAPTPHGHKYFLPPKPRLMVERQEQLETSVKILCREDCSRIAILGGGGFGKTTLALAILHHPEVAKRYELRYFLSCEPLGNVETLLTGLGAILGIKATTSEMLASIRSHLEKSTTILCLDNFETPWDPSTSRTAIEDLLAAIADIPKLSLIITMRGTELPVECDWSLDPLLKPLSTLSSKSAEYIVQSICPNHVIDPFTVKLLDAIEGIPLAITLIAHLLRKEPSQTLWARWSKEQTSVVGTSGDGRRANLNASIALSVNSPRMKKVSGATILLATLALLPDGFPDAQLEGLAECLGVSNIFTLLQTLRDVALIKPLDEVSPSPRIQMLSPIRLFCRQFPELSLEIKQVFENLVAYYVSLLSEAKYNLSNNTYYHQIAPEIKNIHIIFQDAFKATPDGSRDSDFRRLVYAAVYLSKWSKYTGYYTKDTIQIACAKTIHLPIHYGCCLFSIGELHRRENELKEAEECFREAADLFERENEHVWAALASEHLGDVLVDTRRFDEAETVLKTCLKLCIQVDNKLGQANVRYSLGDLYRAKGQYSKAEEYLTDALEAYKSLQNHLGQSNALRRLGMVYTLSDRLMDACQNLEQAVAIYAKINDYRSKVIAVAELGKVYIQLDQISTAEVVLIESAKLELDIISTPYVLTTLGWLYVCGNCLAKAESILDHALILFRKFEDEVNQALVLVHLCTVYLQSNRHKKAEQVLTGDIAEINNQELQMCRLWVLGDLYTTKGQLEDAQTSLDAALVNAKDEQSSYQQGNILRSMGTLHVKQGNFDLAITKFNEALKFHRKAQWVSEQATDFQQLGKAYKKLGRSEDAEAAFKEAKRLMDSVRDTRTLS